MKQRLLLLLLVASAAVGAHAQIKMILHQKNGADIEINFADKPVATKSTLSYTVSTLLSRLID